jgi:hypothetical protein
VLRSIIVVAPNRPRRASWVVGLAATFIVGGCHLAGDPNASECPEGQRVYLGRCTADQAAAQTVVTIRPAQGGTACGQGASDRPPVLSPQTVTVAANADFGFKNEDAVDHEIRGADGKLWATAKRGLVSGDVAISAKGSFAYTVSGCPGGTVVVE